MENKKNSKYEPQEVRVIKKILENAGITNYEPVVIRQLLHYMYTHVTNVLENAKVFSEHAEKTDIDTSDINLAIQIMNETESVPIHRHMTQKLASEVNCIPLPEIKPKCGLRLPPEKYCLLNPNFKLKAQPKPTPVPVIIPNQQFTQNAPPINPVSIDNNLNSSSTLLKRLRIDEIQEQKIMFKPRIKFNIKSADCEQVTKIPRTN